MEVWWKPHCHQWSFPDNHGQIALEYEQRDAAIFVVGTLLAVRRVQQLAGVVRGLDSLLFDA